MSKFNIIDDFFLSDTFSQRVHDLWHLLQNRYTLHTECSSLSCASKAICTLAPDEFSKRSFTSDKSSSSSWSYHVNKTLPADFTILIPLPQHTFVYASRKKATNVNFYVISRDSALRERAFNMLNSLLRGDVILTLGGGNDDENSHPTALVKSAYFDSDHDLCTSSSSRVNTKPLRDVFTTEENKSHLLSYLTRWKSASKLFDSLGITYKLGILLYGPPGTGKTTLVKTIASILSYTVYAVDMSNFPTTPPSFDDLDDAIILFEDIDYIFSSAAQEKDTTVSARANALLQTLDGVHSSSNLIFIATTNDVNALNGALVRDGRFDLKIEMEEIGAGCSDERSSEEEREAAYEEAKRMCSSYGLDGEAASTLVSDMPLPINQAALQNKCIQWIFDSFKEDDSTTSTNEQTETQLRVESSAEQLNKALTAATAFTTWI